MTQYESIDELIAEAQNEFPDDGSLGRRLLNALLLYREVASRSYIDYIHPEAALGTAAKAIGEGVGEITLEYVSPSPYDTDIEERLMIEVRRESRPLPRFVPEGT